MNILVTVQESRRSNIKVSAGAVSAEDSFLVDSASCVPMRQKGQTTFHRSNGIPITSQSPIYLNQAPKKLIFGETQTLRAP